MTRQSFELALVRVGDLNINPEYQRLLKEEAKFDHIIKAWDRPSFGALNVFQHTDGTYWVADGWRRRCAAQHKFGDDWLAPCVITSGATLVDEARCFINTNKKRLNVNAVALFMAGLCAGDEHEQALARTLSLYGLEVGRNFKAVGCAEDVAKMGVLDEALSLSESAWHEPPTGFVLKGIGYFVRAYARHPNFQRDRAVVALAGISPALLHANGRRQAAARGDVGGHIGPGVAIAIKELYNKLPGKNLPQFPSKGGIK